MYVVADSYSLTICTSLRGLVIVILILIEYEIYDLYWAEPRTYVFGGTERKTTTRWERRSQIFGNSKSFNCLVGNLMRIRFKCKVKFAKFVSPVSIFRIPRYQY